MHPDRTFNETEAERRAALYQMPVDVLAYITEESERRKRLGLPNARVWQVVSEAVVFHKNRHPGNSVYYLKDGRGPFHTTHEVLDALNVPQEARGQYWHRWDRLPQHYHDLIDKRRVRSDNGHQGKMNLPRPRSSGHELVGAANGR